MTKDTVRDTGLARGGGHEQVENFLQTVMRGLMENEHQKGEQSNKPGHPVMLPSMHLWMGVLLGVLRGLKVGPGYLAATGNRWLVEHAVL